MALTNRPNKKISEKSALRIGAKIAAGIAAAGLTLYGGHKLSENLRAREAAVKQEQARRELVRLESARKVDAVAKAEAKRTVFTNSIQKVRAIYFGSSPLGRPQAKALGGLTNISDKAGITSARVLQTIIIHQKSFFSPNFQRLSAAEKMRELDVHDMRVIDVANGFAGQPADVRKAIREMINAKGKINSLWDLANGERSRERQGEY